MFISVSVTFFYVEKMDANADLMAIAWLLYAIWSVINNLIIAHYIDNTRSKMGRRIPYIRYGSVFYGVLFIICWFPFANRGDEIGLFINFLIVIFLYDIMNSIIGTCFFSLPNEIALTAEGRASLSLYGMIFNLFSMGIAMGIPFILLTRQVGLNPFFHPTIIIIGISSIIILFLTSFGIKENKFAQMQPKQEFIKGLKLTFKNKPFWIFMFPAFCISLLLPIIITGILYYIEYVIVGQSYYYFSLAFIVAMLFGLIFFFWKIPTLGVKKMMRYNFFIISIGFALLLFLGLNAILAAIPFAIIGFCLSGTMIAFPVIIGDVIDNDELITGMRREAIYGGIMAIVIKPAYSIANGLFLLTKKEFGILFAMCVIPAICLIASAIIMKWYPLDGPKWSEKKKYLIELHEKKESEYIQKLAQEKKIRIKK